MDTFLLMLIMVSFECVGCEKDFAITARVAEFWNTVSSAYMIVVALYCMYHHRNLEKVIATIVFYLTIIWSTFF